MRNGGGGPVRVREGGPLRVREGGGPLHVREGGGSLTRKGGGVRIELPKNQWVSHRVDQNRMDRKGGGWGSLTRQRGGPLRVREGGRSIPRNSTKSAYSPGV